MRRRSSAAASRPANQIAHRLVNRVRHPHAGQLTGPMQPRLQYHRIAPVVLTRSPYRFGINAGATTPGKSMPECRDLAIQPVPGRTRLVAEMQLAIAASQLRINRSTAAGRPRYLAEKPHLAAAPTVGNRDHMLGFRHVEGDKRFAILPMVRPPCAGSARPARATLASLLHEKGGPLPHPGDMTSRGAVESHRGDRGRRVSGPFPLPTNGYGVLAPFTGEPLDRKLIETNWDNVQRVITAFRNRVVAPSLILRKLGTTLRQSALSLAMREIARIERTVHNLDWIEDKGLRADTTDVLNKGEARHTLSRATFCRPRRWKRVNPIALLTMPKTGSTVGLRFL